MYKKHYESLLADHPDAKQRTKKQRDEIKRQKNKMQKTGKKIGKDRLDQLVEKKVPKSGKERMQEYREKQTNDGKESEREANKMRNRKMRGREANHNEIHTSSLEDVQVCAEPGEVVFDQDRRLDENMFFFNSNQNICQDQHVH